MKSINRRWAVQGFGVIAVFMILFAVIASLSISQYYYGEAYRELENKANLATGLITRLMDEPEIDISNEIRTIVETFSDKSQMELVGLDRNGLPVVSSSGFSYPSSSTLKMPDYAEAIQAENGRGSYVGELGSGERAMTMTVLLPVIRSDCTAFRFMISLKGVENRIFVSIILIAAVSLLVMLMVGFSGVFFSRSIVRPVRDVGAVVKQIALGNFDIRLTKIRDDELGELTDNINSMTDELQRANQVKNEFISSVSHELRTPLTAIKGWGETLSMTPIEDTETFEKGMHVILGETDRLSGMVEELLDFSRMESGRLRIVKTRIDILAELGDACLMYQARAGQENKRFIYQEPSSLPPVMADSSRLRQVFVNVIDNALKYTDEGDSIYVMARVIDGVVEIQIRDTGIGISEEDLKHVTEKFYKGNTSRRGSGIGLSVVQEIISLHEGTMKIESKAGEGTRVIIRLPAIQKQTEE